LSVPKAALSGVRRSRDGLQPSMARPEASTKRCPPEGQVRRVEGTALSYCPRPRCPVGGDPGMGCNQAWRGPRHRQSDALQRGRFAAWRASLCRCPRPRCPVGGDPGMGCNQAWRGPRHRQSDALQRDRFAAWRAPLCRCPRPRFAPLRSTPVVDNTLTPERPGRAAPGRSQGNRGRGRSSERLGCLCAATS